MTNVSKRRVKKETESDKPAPRRVDPVDRLIAEKQKRDENNCGID